MSVIHRPASIPPTRRLTGLVAVGLATTVLATVITSTSMSRPGAAAPEPRIPTAARPDLASPALDASAALAQGADALQRARETADPAAYAQAEAAFRSVLAAEPENLPAARHRQPVPGSPPVRRGAGDRPPRPA